ncbi:putative lipoprotein [Indibacter alkaliphilus LW1]|jgi:probable lipoprotein NlpC|uniref:Lipoprotein n=1 Tax=Indibacter alkaliphilus (strain CCUG 57479 / KCTC 22604 / LW1) TaxID=1189612 RepID=S2E636_INDAL|nr:C40 family peptidase [Indibacter alkaliphilus]EPA00077.1 putative lipoprotein [Indibacter alkaliphilus LW1]
MNKSPKEIQIKFFYYLIVLLPILIFSSSCASSKKGKNREVDTIISTARSYRGTPYRYGGTTRSGIDCSALIFHAYASVGINLPRTSEAQSKLGKNVSGRNLEKGDLLFFATGKRRRKVSHAGIVTDVQRGRVIFIHSSTSLGVTEDNLANPYWNKAFLFGKRIL